MVNELKQLGSGSNTRIKLEVVGPMNSIIINLSKSAEVYSSSVGRPINIIYPYRSVFR